MAFLSEAEVEQSLLEQMLRLGYTEAREEIIGPDGQAPERDSHDEVILKGLLQAALARLNPHLPIEAQQEVTRRFLQSELPVLLEENRRLHKFMVDGVDIEYYAEDGNLTAGNAKIIDYLNPDNNDWLVVRQFSVIAGHGSSRFSRRPDVVVFVNGLPLVVIELKAPGSENATLGGAFNQLQTYKTQIPALFHSNALLITSDGIQARVGSLSADLERFMPWRTTDGKDIAPKGLPELATLIEGVLDKGRLLELVRRFTVFGETGSGLIKILAGYHQFHAVQRAIVSTLRASASGVLREDPGQYGLPSVQDQAPGDRRAGVIWHTQGSGKSLLMAFYAGQLIQHPGMANPTLVILTDRNDLDDQLFATFAMCKDLIRQTPVQANSREELQEILNRASGGVVFTTIQKFAPETGSQTYPLLTDRRNVVVIADEAHRSQYGFRAKVEAATGKISYGFAKYLRDALPFASFIGFTGTPIEADDVNTPAVFGNYIDVYDISRAVEDGATVPIYYESRLARIELDEDERPKIDAEVDALTEDDVESDQERFKQKWSTVEALVGSDKRMELVAEDMVRHFEDRSIRGKGMIVCMSRRICIKLYQEIVKLRPDWHSEDDTLGAIKIVMTGKVTDPQDWHQHTHTSKFRPNLLAKRARDPDDPLKLVIVRDMWLTGFDAPCMHTMYVDKPMQGHGLMQAIARVNRVFRDKPAGLIVDYIGIAQNLKSALNQYSQSDQEQTGVDSAQAEAVLLEKYEVVRDMFYGFNYASALNGTPHQRLVMMAGAINWILDLQQALSAKEKTEAGKKNAHRSYQDAVLALTKAFALASSTDQARAIREKVGFFQAIRAALVKPVPGVKTGRQDRELAVQQIVSRAVVSTEIVDILAAAGISTPDISILSDAFLLEVQKLDKKNLALEAMRKLLAGSIQSRSKTNVVQTKAFSERLDAAIARYHANAITTAEVLQELINLAKEIRTARQRGEEQGLSEEEIAFYDALAENESAVQMMGDDKLRFIAHELLTSLRQNISVDWAHRESARARLRVMVKKILRKYGYPPDLENAAIQQVLQQAEALSEKWTN
jgi:type I restriction enzyme, R subunit